MVGADDAPESAYRLKRRVVKRTRSGFRLASENLVLTPDGEFGEWSFHEPKGGQCSRENEQEVGGDDLEPCVAKDVARFRRRKRYRIAVERDLLHHIPGARIPRVVVPQGEVPARFYGRVDKRGCGNSVRRDDVVKDSIRIGHVDICRRREGFQSLEFCYQTRCRVLRNFNRTGRLVHSHVPGAPEMIEEEWCCRTSPTSEIEDRLNGCAKLGQTLAQQLDATVCEVVLVFSGRGETMAQLMVVVVGEGVEVDRFSHDSSPAQRLLSPSKLA